MQISSLISDRSSQSPFARFLVDRKAKVPTKKLLKIFIFPIQTLGMVAWSRVLLNFVDFLTVMQMSNYYIYNTYLRQVNVIFLDI